jgi:excinuclease ABC subunit C
LSRFWRNFITIDPLGQSLYDSIVIPSTVRIKNKQLPDTPGVYVMKNGAGKVIYVGKATSLLRRVSSYFQRPHDTRIQQMVTEIREIDYIQKPTAIEALILEANLIKYYFPPYNIREKDNKSFLYLVITKEDFPKPLLVRGKDLPEDASKTYKAVFGPYTSPRSLRAALDLVRKAFPWSTCESGQSRACFYHHLKLCPGVCIDAISKQDYAKIIRDLIRFFDGKKDDILKAYAKEMKVASKEKRFEDAAALRNKIFFLEHIQDVAVLKREDEDVDKIREGEAPINIFGRIEGYDISNISGTSSVASMVVFEDGAPAKAEYRKFRMKTVAGSNDVASMKETLARRFRNDWRHPDLILIDGGWPQVNAAIEVIHEFELGIPVIGLAKGPARDRNDLICDPNNLEICALCERYKKLLIAVRDEAHRFAITYHRKVRSRKMLGGE